jgi:hypothetical protein
LVRKGKVKAQREFNSHKQGLKIATTMHHTKNQYIAIFDAVNDQILAHWESPKANSQIFIARTSEVRMSGK